MRLLHSLFFLALTFFGLNAVLADVVILKDGTRFEGKITLDTADLIRIEVPVTEKIKETKTVAKTDIQEIIKAAPDDEAFAEIQKMVPTGSMWPAERYRTLLRTGPESFLTSFPDSRHAPKVAEVKKTLEDELDKVERGNVKLEGNWYSPQAQIDFREQFESQVTLFRMKSVLQGGRYSNNVAAMREFEKLETRYYGTPAFAEAAGIAQRIVPTLGRQIQALRRDVDVKNQQWETNKNALDEQSRQRVEAARQREEAQFAAAVEADKKAGIKWTRINPRSASQLDSYIGFAAGELRRIKEYDPGALKARAESLSEVDSLIQQGALEKARATLNTITSEEGAKKVKDGYADSLLAKLKAKVEEQKAIAKAREEAKESEALAADLADGRSKGKGGEDKPGSSITEGMVTEADETVAEPKEEESSLDDFDALASVSSKKKETEKAKSSKKPASSKKPTPKAKDKPRSTPAVSEPGGGIPINIIIPIVTVLLIASIVIMKVLGIGGKKEAE